MDGRFLNWKRCPDLHCDLRCLEVMALVHANAQLEMAGECSGAHSAQVEAMDGRGPGLSAIQMCILASFQS